MTPALSILNTAGRMLVASNIIRALQWGEWSQQARQFLNVASRNFGNDHRYRDADVMVTLLAEAVDELMAGIERARSTLGEGGALPAATIPQLPPATAEQRSFAWAASERITMPMMLAAAQKINRTSDAAYKAVARLVGRVQTSQGDPPPKVHKLNDEAMKAAARDMGIPGGFVKAVPIIEASERVLDVMRATPLPPIPGLGFGLLTPSRAVDTVKAIADKGLSVLKTTWSIGAVVVPVVALIAGVILLRWFAGPPKG